jgi:hypothetical protein
MAFDGTTLLDGNDGGVFALTTDDVAGGNVEWTSLNSDLNTIQFTGIALDTHNASVAYGGSQDNGTEKYTGTTSWQLIALGDGGFVRVDPSTQGASTTVFHTFFYPVDGFIERSDDAGATFAAADAGIDEMDPGNFYIPYVMDPSNSRRLLLGTDQIYETTDSGDDWFLLGNPLPTTGTGPVVDSIAVAPDDPETIYVSVFNRANGDHNLFVTTDNGINWTDITPPGATGQFRGIAVDPTDSEHAWVTANGNFTGGTDHVFETTDGGATWDDISGNLPDSPADSVIYFQPTDMLFVGTDVGVYATTASDTAGPLTDWTRFGGGLPNAQSVSLEAADINTQNILAVGTHGRGMWEIELPQAVHVSQFNPPAPTEGINSGMQILAVFTDANAHLNGSASNFTATVSWGDGQFSTTGFSPDVSIVANGDGTFSLLGSHTYAEEATGLNFAIAISDSNGQFFDQTATINVADAPLDITQLNAPAGLTAGQTFKGTVAVFTDANTQPDINDFTATVNWGDGSSSTFTRGNGGIVANGGSFDVNGSHTYDQPLTNAPFTVTVVDLGGASASTSAVINIPPSPLQGSGAALQATEGTALTAVVARFTDANPKEPASNYSALIDWGDNTTSTGTIVLTSAGHFKVTGGHIYTEEGTFTTSIALQDIDGAANTLSGTAVVQDARLAAVARGVSSTEGAAVQATVATFTDRNGFATVSDFTATITWGDGSTSAGQIAKNPAGGFAVTGAHTYAEKGSYTLAVAVTDDGGATATAVGLARVADAPLTGTGTSVSAQAGQPLTATVATFSDANLQAPVSDFTVSINWDDGTTSTGTVMLTGTGTFVVIGTHTYARAGDDTITVTMVDVDGSVLKVKTKVHVT